jgi:hypothetical protein
MKFRLGKDIVKSLVIFGMVEAVLFYLLDQILRWAVTPVYVKNYIPAKLRDDPSQPFDVLNLRIDALIGSIRTVAWTVFVCTQAAALIWLIYGWFARPYRPAMAWEQHILAYFVVLLICVFVGLLVAADGYLWNVVQAGSSEAPMSKWLTEGFRTSLVAGVTFYCILCYMLATAISIPPVMRPATPGATALGRATDQLHVWEF